MKKAFHIPQRRWPPVAACGRLLGQADFRKACILQGLENAGIPLAGLAAVVGRGGMLPPVHSGGYLVNGAMLADIENGRAKPHASNLGAVIAHAIAAPLGIPAYIYDAVSADELLPVAKLTGLAGVQRHSYSHVLNSKAVARAAAVQQGKGYSEMNFIVAHLGGGISITAHQKGRIVDVVSDDEGPFSPQRSGRVPLWHLLALMDAPQSERAQLVQQLKTQSGLMGLLGTSDLPELERRIAAGDENAKLVWEAMAYQIAKGIGEMAPVLSGEIDGILLTGGLAHSPLLTGAIIRRVSFLAPVAIFAGQREMAALAAGALRLLRGEEAPHIYPSAPKKQQIQP